MGCCTGMGRVLLIIFNFLFLLVSMAILAAGVLLRFFTEVIAKFLGQIEVSGNTKDQFNIPDLKDVSELPFVGDIGLALIVFGAILCCISFFACCGACCKFRPLLILFVITMSILIIAQAVVGGLFIAEQSPLHDEIKKTVGDKVKYDFNANGTDVFDFSINMLHYLLGCCGIRGWDDFSNNDKPPSCCNRTIIDGDSSYDDERQQCASDPPTAPDSYYNAQGCYVVLQDKILEHLTLIAACFAAILVIQLLEVIFACLIVKDVNDTNNKVGPY